MTRQADQTLLARLGFADPDKQDSRHDSICQIIATDAQSIIDKISTQDPWKVSDVEMERIVTKGIGQYKTHIGFIDVSMRIWKECEGSSFYRRVNCEVKVQFSLNETIRQIKLYKEYGTLNDVWLLFTLKPITLGEKGLLKNEGIMHCSAEDF